MPLVCVITMYHLSLVVNIDCCLQTGSMMVSKLKVLCERLFKISVPAQVTQSFLWHLNQLASNALSCKFVDAPHLASASISYMLCALQAIWANSDVVSRAAQSAQVGVKAINY